ncbi:MAG: glycosyltransferase [Gomphosphaeria aponina SAG 52.96 = DSM 107014]|uniref:Glycosyltransferase n=1 Tax=Gomphosphaeria aponina SAG 52.96 = DSM 107014 TaxID=1521640 RepID=A0A941GTX4_9CHRO|nr:glycosyltransferase [Gomphosphaeria aponina SAG 52.96 = DSM 107014]
MKILHVIPSIAPIRGGPSKAVIDLVRELRNQGIDAEIATTNDNGDDLLDVPLNKCSEYQEVPVWFFPRFSPPIASIREFAFSNALTKWLWKNITQYDLLHVHAIFSYPSTIAMAIARAKNIPYINRPLGLLGKWPLQQGKQKKQLYLKIIELANLDHAKFLHFTAQQEQKEASALKLKTPSFILPHGISVPSFNPQANEQLRQDLHLQGDEPIILYLSRLHKKKGLEYLIPALGKLKEQQRFTFILAGNGTPEYEIKVTELLEKAQITHQTYRPGFVTGEKKTLFLQGADLFVLTSHSENFGIAVIEALAAGTPVLITPGVALASIVQQNQLGYLTELDPLSIEINLQQCLNNRNDLKQVGDRAREFVLNNYSWEQIVSQLIEIYKSILKSTKT